MKDEIALAMIAAIICHASTNGCLQTEETMRDALKGSLQMATDLIRSSALVVKKLRENYEL